MMFVERASFSYAPCQNKKFRSEIAFGKLGNTDNQVRQVPIIESDGNIFLIWMSDDLVKHVPEPVNTDPIRRFARVERTLGLAYTVKIDNPNVTHSAYLQLGLLARKSVTVFSGLTMLERAARCIFPRVRRIVSPAARPSLNNMVLIGP